LHAHVGWVLEQLLVVGAHVQADGQHAVRGDPSCARTGTDRTDRTDRTGAQTERQTDKQERPTDRKIERQIDRQKRQIDRQAKVNRQVSV
jgi:hypothetical protein